MRINGFKNFLQERYLTKLPPKHAAVSRIDNFDYDTVYAGLSMMYHWFYGSMMAARDEMDDVVELFRSIGNIYHKDLNKENKVYRAVHLRLDEPFMDDKDIKNISTSSTGPKRLQSWSTTMHGAEYFFDHFVSKQNHGDTPKMDKAWVIVEVDVKDLEQLMTFKECLDYFADLAVMGINDSDIKEIAEKLIDRLDDDEMLDLQEIICYTPDEVDIKVKKILVPPVG